MSRYARQIAVPELGAHGHAKLRVAQVLVVGAGGLAAGVLPYLVGAGIGRIRLVDPDVVSESNLHRQTHFAMADIGQPKVHAAAARMAALNPDCKVEPVRAALTPANVADLCDGMALVLDCADSFAASYILSDHCAASMPLISASVVGTDGYVGGFCGPAPSLRAVFPDLPMQMGSCEVNGVLGPVVGVLASLQAQMAVAHLAGVGPSPLGQLVTFDARGFRFGGFRFDTAPEVTGPRFIAPEDLQPTDHIIDLREVDEPGPPLAAQARATVDTITRTPLPDTRVVLACRSGLRAWLAAERLTHSNLALLALGDMTGDPS
ncbi:thiamine biosynthesis protein ThiF [Actibacterium mucosum KCTC 23349]|uniref:Thiamine biosynthesis protein ThiF n=1 Tax=Actibacterium mucosum KCTC 23349 TaxID=1454373 RepID=A0A037ZDP1_9RHOB|nr:HesA/MoeB/ThiF family protein [Actibacterium mucosum]KAJ54257.1 thiamine biosynthesis protein ThiF [Actibacterium mucosum KCTC 23349]